MRRTVALALLLAANATAAFAASPSPVIEETVAAPAPDPIADIVRSQIGSWDCTITYAGLRTPQDFVLVWSGFGDHYVRGTADIPQFRHDPPRKVDVVFGYDTTTKTWTNVFTDSTGAHAFSRSEAGPAKKSLTLTSVFPVDPTIGPSLVVLGARSTTFDNAWTVSGTPRTSHEVCAKIPV